MDSGRFCISGEISKIRVRPVEKGLCLCYNEKEIVCAEFFAEICDKTFFCLEAAGLFLLRFGKEFPFMSRSLTQGPVMKTMLLFALPLVLGDLLQQCYNIADTLVVSRAIGPDALAAVGSAFTLMTFLTSILLGLCLGSGAVFSMRFGEQDFSGLRRGVTSSFVLIGGLSLGLTVLVFAGMEAILWIMQVPWSLRDMMRDYLWAVFWGIPATFLYNYAASLLRGVGNSVVPLVFLAFSALLNVALDLWFVLGFGWGIAGAAWATVISQYLSGLGLCGYTLWKYPWLLPKGEELRVTGKGIKEIAGYSLLTCVQQSVMNFGILMVQGLVNSFGPTVMAAFAAAVKIDAFAYLPVQDFGNGFSTFAAQNYGAGRVDRLKRGFRGAVLASLGFGLVTSALVWVLAEPLMGLFVDPAQTEIVAQGVEYLRIEGAFYWGIGWLFLWYGLYRGVGKPGMSVVLTVISLGSRVALAYILCPDWLLGVSGIWWAVPIGWFLADAAGLFYYGWKRKSLFERNDALQKGT